MVCPLCGLSDDSIGSLDLHYRRHEVEALVNLNRTLERWLPEIAGALRGEK